MRTDRHPLSISERWHAWRQRLRGEQEDLLSVFVDLTLPQKRAPEAVGQRVNRAAALCDAALFMLWLAGIARPEIGRRLQPRQVSLINLRPADVVTFIGSLTAYGVDDKALSGLTRAQEDIRDLMLTMDDFSGFVIAAASREVQSATSDPIFALGSLAAASLPRDTHIQCLVAAVNHQSRASWTAIYRQALERYGRRLNDELKVEVFTRTTAILAEGALAHSRSDPADVTSADMLAGIQLIANAFVARTETLTDG